MMTPKKVPATRVTAGPLPRIQRAATALGGSQEYPSRLDSGFLGCNQPLPEGTGIRVEPGSLLVAQMHYNTSSAAPVADQSVIEIATTDAVEKEATVMQAVDFGWITNGHIGGDAMTIPAGEEHVVHDTSITFDSIIVARARETLGLATDTPLMLYTAGHHMHELGKTQRTELNMQTGAPPACSTHQIGISHGRDATRSQTRSRFGTADTLWMECSWDNSASNQPIVNGEVQEPMDVEWGEGTSDEMCLSGFYVTGQ